MAEEDDYSWHKEEKLNKAVTKFHDRYASEPDMTDAKGLHQLYMEELQRKLVEGIQPRVGQPVCSRVEYTGSSYEGTKVSRSDTDMDFEFDVMVILRCDADQLQVQETDTPGYVKLLQKGGAQQITWCVRMAVDNNVLLPDKLMNKFYGELVRCKRQCQEDARACDDLDDEKRELLHIDDRIKLRRHGPAVQMDIMQGPQSSTKFYSVDMVPAIEIPRGNGKIDYYVAKPIKGQSGPQNSWRQSFSLEEKKRLVTADKDNCCRKQVFRVLKVIRNREPGLAPLTSYHLKTALFRTMDRRTEQRKWKTDRLGRRLMDVIGQLEKDLDDEDMPHYYLPGVDLLQGIGDDTVEKMRNRLERLMQSEQEMMKLLAQ